MPKDRKGQRESKERLWVFLGTGGNTRISI